MPELAEVEYFRRQWNGGIGKRVASVSLHPHARVFRGADVKALVAAVEGSKLARSEARGKQMLFQFSAGAWIGIHLGMTGSLRIQAEPLTPAKHDHLVLRQRSQALVFTDPRQFGRVRFHLGKSEPLWWSKLPPSPDSPAFTRAAMRDFLQRHRKLAIKAALLLQTGFPGIGNWMADEVLWRAQLNPHTRCGDLTAAQLAKLWRTTRFVCRGAMRHVSRDFSDPPRGWLIHERWAKTGRCPLHRELLSRAIIGGRTSVWCRRCQR